MKLQATARAAVPGTVAQADDHPRPVWTVRSLVEFGDFKMVDHALTTPVGSSAWFKDPDGNTIALFQPTDFAVPAHGLTLSCVWIGH